MSANKKSEGASKDQKPEGASKDQKPEGAPKNQKPEGAPKDQKPEGTPPDNNSEGSSADKTTERTSLEKRGERTSKSVEPVQENPAANAADIPAVGHQLRDYYKSLIELLRCSNPRCRRYLSVPTNQCIEGHSICPRCVHKNCSVCGQMVIDTENIILNNIVRKLIFPCVNKSKGCREHFPPRLLKKHERECHYGMVTCKLRGCGHKCAHTVLWEHTVNNHPGTVCSIATAKIVINVFHDDTHYNFILFGLYDCLFNGLLTYIETKKTICGAAQLVHQGSKRTNKYLYEIYLAESEIVQHLLHSKEVLGEEEDIDEAIRENNCFSLQLKSLVNEVSHPSATYAFHFKIVPTKLAKKNFR